MESRQRKKWEKKEEETVSIRRVPDHMSMLRCVMVFSRYRQRSDCDYFGLLYCIVTWIP